MKVFAVRVGPRRILAVSTESRKPNRYRGGRLT